MHGFDGFISLHHRDNRSPKESCVSAACVAAATVWKNLKGKTYESMVCKSQTCDGENQVGIPPTVSQLLDLGDVMKKFLMATAAALALSVGSAFAADLAPVPYYKAPPPAPTPVNTWAGFYLGGQVGGAWSDSNYTLNNGVGTI